MCLLKLFLCFIFINGVLLLAYGLSNLVAKYIDDRYYISPDKRKELRKKELQNARIFISAGLVTMTLGYPSFTITLFILAGIAYVSLLVCKLIVQLIVNILNKHEKL